MAEDPVGFAEDVRELQHTIRSLVEGSTNAAEYIIDKRRGAYLLALVEDLEADAQRLADLWRRLQAGVTPCAAKQIEEPKCLS